METQTTLRDLIVKELGLEEISADVQEDILIALTEATIKKTIMEVMDRLSPEDQAAVDEIADKDDANPDDLIAFLNTRIPNLDELIAEQSKLIIADFKGSKEEGN